MARVKWKAELYALSRCPGNGILMFFSLFFNVFLRLSYVALFFYDLVILCYFI